MKFIITITCLLLIYSGFCHHFANGNSEYEQIAQGYLNRAGLRISAHGEGADKWVTLCSVKARVASTGWRTKHDKQRCTTTVGGEILETRVIETENNWRCGWRTETYASNTLLRYKELINNQYQSAINAAVRAKESGAAISFLEEQKTLHTFNLEVATNRDTAMLEATATGLSRYRGGGSCAVKLEARVRHLAY